MARTVLVVDDDASRIFLTIAMIEECGFVAIGVSDGDKARRIVEQKGEDIGIVITDVRMPGELDGLALARWIRETRPHIRVFVTSGFDPDPETVMPEGVIFLPKVWLTVDVMNFVLSSHESDDLMRRR